MGSWRADSDPKVVHVRIMIVLIAHVFGMRVTYPVQPFYNPSGELIIYPTLGNFVIGIRKIFRKGPFFSISIPYDSQVG